MNNYNYEDKQNQAFAALINNAVMHMKNNGASDSEVKSLIDDSILGIINTIQDYRQFPDAVYSIVNESSKKKNISEERQVGMMCELLDRIEESLIEKVYDLLRKNNGVSFSEEKFKNSHGIQMNDVLDALMQMQRDGDLDIEIDDLDH